VHPRLVRIVQKVAIQSIGRKREQSLGKGVSEKGLQTDCPETISYFYCSILFAFDMLSFNSSTYLIFHRSWCDVEQHLKQRQTRGKGRLGERTRGWGHFGIAFAFGFKKWYGMYCELGLDMWNICSSVQEVGECMESWRHMLAPRGLHDSDQD
jgi:hypothetical protein